MSEKKPDHVPPCLLPMITRRRLLKSAAASAAIAPIAAACGGLPGEFVTVNKGTFEPLNFALTEEAFAPLETVGGLAYAKVDGSDGSIEVVLVRSADDEVLAFDHKCPHAQLGIGPAPDVPDMFLGEWLPDERALRCNWHKSTFRPDGAYVPELSPETSGVSNIAVYTVAFDAAAGTGTVTF